ncbi:MAG: potassium channel family protein [Thermaurantimonas sp.]|uniref:potassium channel family protein n=1 Tax=Thermaurantimonas sp. TaxID=2681568 RepID=UPI00391DE00D
MKGKKFAVIGLGRFGSAIARKLSERGAEVMAIDINEQKVEDIKEDVAYAITLDSTDPKNLESQNIQEMDAVVVAIGTNFQDLILTTFALMELDVERIIVRAQDPIQKRILEKIGVREILSLEDEVSNNVAEQLLNPSVLMSIRLPDDYEIIEVKAPRIICNRTLADIGLREKYNINLITLMRKGKLDDKMHIIGVPEPATKILENDIIVIFGKSKDIDRFLEINE